jgi:hypothetical protein
VGIKGKGLNVSDISYRYARRRRRVILFLAALSRPYSGRGDEGAFLEGSAVGAKITATKHNFVPGQRTVTGS